MRTPVHPLSDGSDPAELRFRLDSVPAGVWVTLIVCLAGFGYVLGFDHPHDLALGLLTAVAGIGGIVILMLPWETIVRSRWRELAFGAWSALDLALITALAALAGGGDSVFVALFVIPIVFAGLSYPRTMVIAVSVGAVLCYAGLAAASSTHGDYALMYGATLASTALMSTWQARNHERRRGLLAIASRTDPLTGALNRRGFQQAAAAMLGGVARLAHPAALVLLDLDHFKQYNDSRGHAAGDELLQWVVDCIRRSLRPTDSIARMGGDEFALLLVGADRRAAEVAVARIAQDLEARVQTSCGIAAAPQDAEDIDELYRLADAQLYEAKRARPAEPEPLPRPSRLRSV